MKENADVLIRRANVSDANLLSQCIDAAYARYKDRINDLPDVSSGVVEDIEQNSVFLAELDHSLAGGLILVLRDSDAFLANLAVHPDFGGRGIASRLIERAVLECRVAKCKSLLLSTHIDMPENVRFYQRLGWAETSRENSKIRMERLL